MGLSHTTTTCLLEQKALGLKACARAEPYYDKVFPVQNLGVHKVIKYPAVNMHMTKNTGRAKEARMIQPATDGTGWSSPPRTAPSLGRWWAWAS